MTYEQFIAHVYLERNYKVSELIFKKDVCPNLNVDCTKCKKELHFKDIGSHACLFDELNSLNLKTIKLFSCALSEKAKQIKSLKN